MTNKPLFENISKDHPTASKQQLSSAIDEEGKVWLRSVTARLRRLASDQRATGLWKAFHGDQAACEDFLFVVTVALLELADIDKVKKVYDEVVSELRDLERALQTVDDYCRGIRDLEWLPDLAPRGHSGVLHLPDGLEDHIEALRIFAREKAAFEREHLMRLLPTSRKAASDFLFRVHFSRLLVRKMVQRFQRKRFQLVADTINALFQIGEDDEVTFHSVRAAWNRQELGDGRNARRVSVNQKRAIRRA